MNRKYYTRALKQWNGRNQIGLEGPWGKVPYGFRCTDIDPVHQSPSRQCVDSSLL